MGESANIYSLISGIDTDTLENLHGSGRPEQRKKR